jgi:hypothetical protein
MLQDVDRWQHHGGRRSSRRGEVSGRDRRGSDDADLDRYGQEHGRLGTALKRYVSYYFTNFPAHLSLYILGKASKFAEFWWMFT